MSDDDLTPSEPMGADGSATFDMSELAAKDVPYIGPSSDATDVEPDHTASADLPPDTEPASGSRFRRKRGRADKVKPETPKVRNGALVKPLTEMYTSVGLMLAPFDPACSIVFVENAKRCAESLDALARENDAVRRALLALTQTSAWGGVMIAHLPLLLVVMSHHGPRDMAERVAPLAAMLAPNAAAAAAAQGNGDHAA